MLKRIFLKTIFLLSFFYAFCCFNETRVLLNGSSVETHSGSTVPYAKNFKANKVELQKKLSELASLWHTEKNIDAYSDFGVHLAYLGEYEKAKAVFAEIEVMSPGRYATAANIGTVYELLDKKDSALFWIKRAIQINPLSHDSSEWLHVKILEAKLDAGNKINTSFLLGTEFGDDTIPKTLLSSIQLEKLRDALYYQLNERLSFIKPKDEIIGLLLFELGNITALTDDVTTSLRNYDLAVSYGYYSDVMEKRYNKFKGMQKVISNEYTSIEKLPFELEKEKRANRNKIIIISWLFAACVGFFIWVSKRM